MGTIIKSCTIAKIAFNSFNYYFSSNNNKNNLEYREEYYSKNAKSLTAKVTLSPVRMKSETHGLPVRNPSESVVQHPPQNG